MNDNDDSDTALPSGSYSTISGHYDAPPQGRSTDIAARPADVVRVVRVFSRRESITITCDAHELAMQRMIRHINES